MPTLNSYSGGTIYTCGAINYNFNEGKADVFDLNNNEILCFYSDKILEVKERRFHIIDCMLDVVYIHEQGENISTTFLINDLRTFDKILSYIQNPTFDLLDALELNSEQRLDDFALFFDRVLFTESYHKYHNTEGNFRNKVYVLYSRYNRFTYGPNNLGIKGDAIKDYAYNYIVLNTPDENIHEIADKLNSITIDHIGATRERIKIEKEEAYKRTILQRKKIIDGSPIDVKDFETKLKNIANLAKERKEIVNQINFWRKAEQINVVDAYWCKKTIENLSKEVNAIDLEFQNRKINALNDQYGSIDSLKSEFLKNLSNASFQDALSIFRESKNTERILLEEKNCSTFEGGLSAYDPYIEFFNMASVYASNYLNEINRNKTKRVNIPRYQIDNALMYMFNTDNVNEANYRRRQSNYLKNKSYGEKGESEVDYAIKWLVGDYIRMKRTNTGKYGEPSIVLNNSSFIDEPQEFDHIVIGPQGVFNIETKNYSGKLIIDKYGNWIRRKDDGSESGVRNPQQQVRRHEAVLRSILGDEVPIISILVIANPSSIIEGVENCKIPILKADTLEAFISNYKNDSKFSIEEMKKISQKIDSYRTTK